MFDPGRAARVRDLFAMEDVFVIEPEIGAGLVLS